jgi:hypothetical protein
MRLLLATNHLGMGGSESYLLTVAEQFERLGHEVRIYAPESGGGVGVAREMNLTLIGEADLSGDYDAALVQDSGVSLQVADRCPGLPQLFVAHSAKFDLQAPPQLDGLVAAVVVLNDRVARRVRSFAAELEVVRLRQPIDSERFTPRGSLPATPRSALLLSNAPTVDRLTMLESACAEAGLELKRLGGLTGQTGDVRPAVAGVEIVIGYGRSILEAMACGRAAYVYDWKGGDGWVTPQSYPAIEADGFAGSATGGAIDAARLVEDLSRYSAEMGPVGHDLVMARHRASVHAEQLLDLLGGLADPPARPPAPLQEMARLVRLEWRARADSHSLVHENAHLRTLLAESERKAIEAHAEAGRHAEAAADAAQQAKEIARVYEGTVSWRLTRPLRALMVRLRRGGRRGPRPAAGPGSGPTMSAEDSPPPSRDGDPEKAPPATAP